MFNRTLLVLTLVTCALGATLPLRRLPHSGPARGLAVSRGRIYGGHDATKGQFPYIVSLQYAWLGSRLHNCGGSVISTTAVLTAGHCELQDIDYFAVAGEHDLSKDEGTEQVVLISQQIVHSSYPGNDAVAPYDIAVFRLQTALTLDSFVQIISLPTASSIPSGGSTAVVSGWGTTPSAGIPDILQTGEVSVIDYETCKLSISAGSDLLTDTMICTVPLKDETYICGGDSGGPLAQDNVLIGVVSWGSAGCDSPGGDSVYTRVSASIDFIKANADV